MIIAACLVLAGLLLAIRPLDAARFANNLRFVPYSNAPDAVRYYRLSGWAIVATGVLVGLLLG